MQYKVPQNVQIEDRILPFMTLRQLIICAVGGGIAYLLYLNLEQQPTAVWLPIVAVIGALTTAIAFLKINNIPFTQYVLYVLERMLIETKRHWIKSAGDIYLHENLPKKQANTDAPTAKKLSSVDIARLSQTLDADEIHQLKHQS